VPSSGKEKKKKKEGGPTFYTECHVTKGKGKKKKKSREGPSNLLYDAIGF